MHADVMELKSSAGKLIYKTCLKMEKTTFFSPFLWLISQHITSKVNWGYWAISYPRCNWNWICMLVLYPQCVQKCAFKKYKKIKSKNKISVRTSDHRDHLHALATWSSPYAVKIEKSINKALNANNICVFTFQKCSRDYKMLPGL